MLYVDHQRQIEIETGVQTLNVIRWDTFNNEQFTEQWGLCLI
jgi:hypothetical protein